MNRVLVTGASGFVGVALCRSLRESGVTVREAVRTNPAPGEPSSDRIAIGEIGSQTDWHGALSDVDVVIHLAARAHVLGDPAANATAYFETNERGTWHLASEAAKAGVRRFVYLSSIKVNGEETTGAAYSAADTPNPQDAYATSKWAGEKHLKEVCASTGMQAVIVRSPLVYGPGVRANFLRLMRWVKKGTPLPLGTVRNRRSLVSIWTLCSLLGHVAHHPDGGLQTWMVSDGEDLSTPELIRRIAHAMRRPARLVPVPVNLLLLGGSLLGMRAEVMRLCGSLAVDIQATRELLGWVPPLAVDEAIDRTVAWYLGQERQNAA